MVNGCFQNERFCLFVIDHVYRLHSLIPDGAPPLMTEDAVTDCYIYGCTRAETEEEEFKPKYKYFEDLRDIRREKDILLKLRQSPGIKRRKDKDKTKTDGSRPCVKLKTDEGTSTSQA